MAESTPRGIFGIHDIRIFDRDTWLSLAYYRVLGNVQVDFSAEFAELKGGSYSFPIAAHPTAFKSSVQIEAREYTSDILYTALGYGTRVETAASATGGFGTITNVKGTSVVKSTGILTPAQVITGSAGDLKEGWYVIKATAATKILVYAMSSANFARGTDGSFSNDDGLITSDSLTVTTDKSTVVTNYGFKLMGGAGAINMTANDTAKMFISKPHGGRYTQTIGELPMDFPEVGMVITSEDEGGIVSSLTLYRVKIAGAGFPFTEKGYGSFNVNCTVMYDTDENAIAYYTRTTPE